VHISYIFLHLPSFTFVDNFWFDPFSSRLFSAWNQQIEVHQIHLDGALSPKQRLTRLQRGDHPTDVMVFCDICWSTFQLASLGSWIRSTLIRKELSCEPERYTLKQRMTSSGMMERLMDRDPAGSLLFERPSHFGFCGGACWWSQQHFLAEGEKTNNRSSRRSHETAQRDQMQNCLVIWRLEDSSLPCGRLVWCIFVIPTRSKLQASWAWPSIEQQTCCDDLLWRGWLIGGNLSNSDSGCACGSCRSLFVSSFYLFFVLFVCLLACLFDLLLLSLVGRLVGLFCRCRRRRRRRCCCCSNLCEHATCPHVLFIVPASQDLPLYYIQLDRQRLKAWIYLRVMSEVAFDWQIPGGFTTCWMNLEDWSIHSYNDS